ncbi:MAG: hypothetical protein IT212_07660 [Bacteroidia bacterium]|nr:hypothetical protein [Bacteroidia bacterium]
MRKLADKEKPMEVNSIGGGWDPRPEVRFTDKDLPSIKTWKVGKEYMLVVKVKMKSHDFREDGTSANFTVVSVGVEEKE